MNLLRSPATTSRTGVDSHSALCVPVTAYTPGGTNTLPTRRGRSGFGATVDTVAPAIFADGRLSLSTWTYPPGGPLIDHGRRSPESDRDTPTTSSYVLPP